MILDNSLHTRPIKAVSQSVIALAGKSPGPRSSSLSWHLTTSNHELKSTQKLPPHNPPCLFDGQMVPSACARYLPLGVQTPHPHPILAYRPPTTSNHVSTLAHTLPLRPPPFLIDGQAVPSAFARYLPLVIKTTRPHPISASRPPTTATDIFPPKPQPRLTAVPRSHLSKGADKREREREAPRRPGESGSTFDHILSQVLVIMLAGVPVPDR